MLTFQLQRFLKTVGVVLAVVTDLHTRHYHRYFYQHLWEHLCLEGKQLSLLDLKMHNQHFQHTYFYNWPRNFLNPNQSSPVYSGKLGMTRKHLWGIASKFVKFASLFLFRPTSQTPKNLDFHHIQENDWKIKPYSLLI